MKDPGYVVTDRQILWRENKSRENRRCAKKNGIKVLMNIVLYLENRKDICLQVVYSSCSASCAVIVMSLFVLRI